MMHLKLLLLMLGLRLVELVDHLLYHLLVLHPLLVVVLCSSWIVLHLLRSITKEFGGVDSSNIFSEICLLEMQVAVYGEGYFVD